jgi:hypothetical protein
MSEDKKKKNVKTVNVKLGRQTPVPKNTVVIVKPKSEQNGETK